MPSVDKPSLPTPWRSLAEVAGAPEFRAFLEREFPAGDRDSGVNRRRWMQIMGASAALAGVAGCRWQKEEIRAFDKRPVGRVPGEPQHYHTCMEVGGHALGLRVTSYDGRPIKVEGNPDHPASLGATDCFAQAAILGLYDPDRSGAVVQTEGATPIVHESWEAFDEFAREHFAALRKSGGEGFRVLAEVSTSPTLGRLREKLREQFPEARWHEYDPLDPRPWGERVEPDVVGLGDAQVIVCLDCDLLGSSPGAVRHAREFSSRRDPAGEWMNRLYVVESAFTLTGAMADHRLAIRSSQMGAFAAKLRELVSDAPAIKATLGDADALPAERFAAAVAEDLLAHRGRCLVIAGTSQPATVHRAVVELSQNLMDDSRRDLAFVQAGVGARREKTGSLAELAADIQAGKVETLLLLGVNPVYDAPVDLGFGAAMTKVPTSIHLGLYRDETGRLATWHLPQAHFLESWGDAWEDGTYSAAQPLIEPLPTFGGRSAIGILARVLGEDSVEPRERVKESFRGVLGERPGARQTAGEDDFETLWKETLARGFWSDEAFRIPLSADLPDSAGPLPQDLSFDWSADDLEIVFLPDASVRDGRFANNAWLQETPDPMTKITWDNAAVFSPATAEALGIRDGDVVRLKYKDRDLEIAATIMPGQASGSVAVALGYGRTAAGLVGGSVEAGVPPVGANANAIRTSKAPWFDRGLKVERTGRRHALATTQDHWAIDVAGMRERRRRVGRQLRDVPLALYEDYAALSDEDREHENITGEEGHHPKLFSLWEEHRYDGHRWGLSVDLSKCTGCNACVVACQAENNVPVVGRERVLDGREMHWIRVDRHFTGDPESPQAAHQPVMCQQCEMAPCEQVCPVAATVHSREGLNDMVYNRCIGTRYCANNCPYKVRRFNYFDYHPDLNGPGREVKKMAFNPEVTIRSRGVMEKCTFCVQRIQAVKIEAKNARRPIEDGEIKTACQQACPAQAIVFGDLNAKDSRVAQAHAAIRAYGLLAELNFRPRLAYLARVRNPNPLLAQTTKEPSAAKA